MSSQHILYDTEVTLRAPKPEDAADRLALGRDPEIVRRFGGDTSNPLPPLKAGEVSRWLDRITAHPHAWVVEGGRERESALVAGERHDDVITGILSQEFAA